MSGMIHWAPEGGQVAACGEQGTVVVSMARPNCTLCRTMISMQIDAVKHQTGNEEPQAAQPSQSGSIS